MRQNNDSVPAVVLPGVVAMFVLAWLGVVFGVPFIIALGVLLPALLLISGFARGAG